MKSLLSFVTDNLTPLDTDRLYDDMLDECYSFESVGGIFASMSPSRVLSECDPIAYRCGKVDYLDSLGTVEIDGNEYDGDEVEKERDKFIDDLESQIADIETEIETLESDRDPEATEIDADTLSEISVLKSQIAALESQVKEAEAYTF